ncbi:Transcriptional regulator lysR family [Candidatus Phaeomarinobacter ectocarpi]|uniref:Transcriptional regulator lysR family n=1 Tax=Candidatus Phaeomarinibacter ectocarpi TaxID=1458461 RepID=X5MNY7_9HYPH|nr:LysR family transcriptional regulator [Candidatus Phaeomarinobacter ectocarpi]CDO60611.1 Transcriptional regulator lysR family [Candidatus Phaeomarinobacter ectocarpi]
MSWDHWRSFLAVLDTGSLSGAADRLGLTQPTLGRHIEALEAGLETSLFVRSVRGLTPTDMALSLRPHAEAMQSAAAALVRSASAPAQALSGTIRLTVSEFMGAHVIPGILAPFVEEHPDIAVELVLSDHTDNLSAREADIAVRMVAPTQDALVGLRLGTVRVALYAHKSYVAKHGIPQSLSDDASGHRFIGFDKQAWVMEPLQEAGYPIARDFFSLRTDRDAAQVALLKAGAGISGCHMPLGNNDPDLVPVLHDAFGFDLEMWLVMHEDLRRVTRMRALFDHLDQGLRSYLKM